jgi:hypothetical protein
MPCPVAQTTVTEKNKSDSVTSLDEILPIVKNIPNVVISAEY